MDCKAQDKIFMPYEQYFANIHAASKSTVKITRSNFTVALVTIGSTNQLKNVEYLEMPGLPLDSVGKEYLTKIFQSANGRWSLSNVKLSKNLEDKIIIFNILLRKKNENLEMAMHGGDNAVAFLLDILPGIEAQKGIPHDIEQPLSLVFD